MDTPQDRDISSLSLSEIDQFEALDGLRACVGVEALDPDLEWSKQKAPAAPPIFPVMPRPARCIHTLRRTPWRVRRGP